MKLTIASYGFFLFPVKDGRCEIFAAPAVEGVEHECRLYVLGNVISSSVLGIDSSGDQVAIRRCSIRSGVCMSAELANFGLIVDFSTLRCEAKLKREWATAEPKHTDVQIELSRGRLTAYADQYTNEKRWKWKCDEQQFVRSITSLVVYEQDDWNGALELVPRRQNGTTGKVAFSGGAVTLALLHGPTTAAQPKQIDDSHDKATLELCSSKGKGKLSYGEEEPQTSSYPKPSLPGEVVTFLGLDKDVEIKTKGRPNCGARQMAL